MRHILTLQLSEDVYSLLLKLSEQTGHLPEVLATQWVISETRKQTEDPLEEFIGRFKFGSSDWADSHDRFIGEILNGNMKAE